MDFDVIEKLMYSNIDDIYDNYIENDNLLSVNCKQTFNIYCPYNGRTFTYIYPSGDCDSNGCRTITTSHTFFYVLGGIICPNRNAYTCSFFQRL